MTNKYNKRCSTLLEKCKLKLQSQCNYLLRQFSHGNQLFLHSKPHPSWSALWYLLVDPSNNPETPASSHDDQPHHVGAPELPQGRMPSSAGSTWWWWWWQICSLSCRSGSNSTTKIPPVYIYQLYLNKAILKKISG